MRQLQRIGRPSEGTPHVKDVIRRARTVGFTRGNRPFSGSRLHDVAPVLGDSLATTRRVGELNRQLLRRTCSRLADQAVVSAGCLSKPSDNFGQAFSCSYCSVAFSCSILQAAWSKSRSSRLPCSNSS